MNWNIIEGKWKEMAGSIREKWGKLTDDEIQEIAGKKDKLEGILQTKYGLTQELAAQQVDEWADKIKETITK
ncbi:MAG: CsbD family protein [Chthonomonadaceae bacterium]|nr:CsbD family protein [Chthonomonadaceae bacterium]